jgi:hypothetical protein
VTKPRRNIPRCEVGLLCKCKRNKCWSLLQGRKLHIFNNFWNLGDFNIQNAYLLSCIKATRPKQVCPKESSKYDSCRKSSTFSYHVKVEGRIYVRPNDIASFRRGKINARQFEN